MSDNIDLDWLEDFRQTANNDQELSVIGEWFTTTFSVNFGAQRVAF